MIIMLIYLKNKVSNKSAFFLWYQKSKILEVVNEEISGKLNLVKHDF